MATNDGDGRLRRWARWRPRSPRRLAPGLLIVALLALPTGWVVRGRIIDARPASSPGFGGRGLFGDAVPDDELGLGASETPDLGELLDPELLEAVPVGADEVAEPVEAILNGAMVIDALDDSGIPAVARDAYDRAELELADADPACGVEWSLLAAIGRVESDHGRFGGSRLTEDGDGTVPILGIPLDGRPNVALIRDTDGGELDRDRTFDRAVGPMQIIPSTWRGIASDGNGDERRDPNNIYDAALGAARYLCAGNDDLREREGRRRALRRYNNADEYGLMVLRLATMYATGDLRIIEEAIARGTDRDDRPPAPPVPAPAPLPSPPAPPPTATPTTAPATTARPATTTPAPTTTTTRSPATTTTSTTTPAAEPPAAVGWAPATRVVVVRLIEGQAARPATSTTSTTTTTATSGRR